HLLARLPVERVHVVVEAAEDHAGTVEYRVAAVLARALLAPRNREVLLLAVTVRETPKALAYGRVDGMEASVARADVQDTIGQDGHGGGGGEAETPGRHYAQ